jgi:hypothetical protein
MQQFAFAVLGLLGLPAYDRRGYGCTVLRLMSAFCSELGRHGCSAEDHAALLQTADELLQARTWYRLAPVQDVVPA